LSRIFKHYTLKLKVKVADFIGLSVDVARSQEGAMPQVLSRLMNIW